MLFVTHDNHASNSASGFVSLCATFHAVASETSAVCDQAQTPNKTLLHKSNKSHPQTKQGVEMVVTAIKVSFQSKEIVQMHFRSDQCS